MDEAYKQPSPVAGAVGGGGGGGGGGHSEAAVRRKKGASAAGQSHQEQLPPRSRVKAAAKVCVPTLEDALDDVQVRFVLNLPEAELSSADRLFFQLEQAWWFYEDFIADAHKHLPHFKLKEFAKLMFEHCEALRPLSGKYNELFEYFRSWKGTIPTAGCILLNAAMTDVVLVKCWKGNSRGLPKGKINQGEPAIDAAIREVQEETGYDARGGVNEKDFLTLYLNGQQTTMFVVVGVDETFPFEPQVRKEISAVEWFPLDALPSRSFGVEPFVPRLRRWMAKTKGVRAPKSATAEARTQSLIRVRKARATSPDVSHAAAAAVLTSQSQPSSPTGGGASSNGTACAKKQGSKGAAGGGGNGGGGKDHAPSTVAAGDGVRACSAPNRRGGGGGGGGGGYHAKAKGYDRKNRDTFGGADHDANGGWGGDGWDFEAMLAANERLTGRTFVYDGNPHEFGDPAQSAQASAAAAPPTRDEDQVGHLKQRGAGAAAGKNNRKPAKGAAGGGRKAAAPGDAEGGPGKGRSRSRGKDKGRATAKPKSNAAGAGTDATTSGGGGGGGGGASAATSASVRSAATAAVSGCCSEEVVPSSLCTEGAGGTQALSLWDAPAAAAGAPSNGRAGVFGDFKFDMRDILSAVPQG
ncbi:unnamed protein product [Ectocarpus sp. CCAP 1310/34]|nr:unnamed protein product [Ectocarpus sp. CCAP 1310/34]